MKTLTLAIAMATASSFSLAENHVPALSAVLSGLSDSQRSTFETDIGSAMNLNADIDAVFEAATINQALEQGVITAAQAEQAEQALAIIEANADSFSFDVQDAIADALANGVDLDEISQTLNVFDTLSDADKAIVGQEAFGDPSQSAEAQALWDQLSPDAQSKIADAGLISQP